MSLLIWDTTNRIASQQKRNFERHLNKMFRNQKYYKLDKLNKIRIHFSSTNSRKGNYLTRLILEDKNDKKEIENENKTIKDTLNGTLEKIKDWLNELDKKYSHTYPHLRPSKDEYYLNLAKAVCKRATCTKVEIGAVIIKDDQVISTGYCGAPRGTKSSQEHGFCLRKQLGIPSGQRYEICRSVHAEQNAIINAARSGSSLLGGDMYIYGKIEGDDNQETFDAFPCFICKKMLINCGLNRVICSLKNGGYKIFKVDEWIEDWRKGDIIDDKFQYGVEFVDNVPKVNNNPIRISKNLENKIAK